MCVCLCARSACSPASTGCGVRCGCVCWGSGLGRAPPLLAGVFGCVCVCVRAPILLRHSWLGCAVWVCVLGLGFRLLPATPGSGVRCGCVFLGSGLGCAPPLLARVLVCVCVCVGAPLVPHHSWLACALWVCVLGLGLRLLLATPGWGVRCACVFLGSGLGCAPPLLAGVLGCVCVFMGAPLVPHHSGLRCAVWVCVLGLGFRLRPATPGWAACVCWVSPGTCYCAVVRCGWCAQPGFAAVDASYLSLCLGCGRRLAPLVCLVALGWCAAPRLVRSLSVLRLAVLTPWCLSPPRGLAPPDLLGGCAGHAEVGWEPRSLCLAVAAAEAAVVGSLGVVPVQGPAMGLSLAGPSSVCLGLPALRWFACMDPVTDAAGLPYRPSVHGGFGRCTEAVSCGRRHRPLQVGGGHARVWCVCVCVRAPLRRVGRAGLPGAFWCASRFPVAVISALMVCLAPSGLGLPCLCLFLCFFSFFFAPPCLSRSVFSGPQCLGPSPLVVPPLSFVFLFLLSPPPPACFFFLLFFCLFGFFFYLFFLPPSFLFFCPAVVCWLCGAGVVCPGLLGVLGGTLGVHRTSWCIPFPRHACTFLVLGSLGAWMSHAPKAAQALGCSLTPGLRMSFGRVTCMARAASVAGLPALGFLLLCGVCVWVWVTIGCGFC